MESFNAGANNTSSLQKDVTRTDRLVKKKKPVKERIIKMIETVFKPFIFI